MSSSGKQGEKKVQSSAGWMAGTSSKRVKGNERKRKEFWNENYRKKILLKTKKNLKTVLRENNMEKVLQN